MFFKTGRDAPATCRRSKTLARNVFIFAVTVSLFPVGLLKAQVSGNCIFDSTFGEGGHVTIDFADGGGSNLDVASFVVLQPDGKILEGGQTTATEGEVFAFALARYQSNGDLDYSFGRGGKVTTPFRGLFSNMQALALQPDGKIVAAGFSYSGGSLHVDYVMARYNSDGHLDRGFGHGGRVIISGLDFDLARRILIQRDGKIVLGGAARDPEHGDVNFALARYHDDGSLDTTFGTGGKVITGFPALHSRITSLALQRDGKIVAAGYTYANDKSAFALARYNPDGQLDTTFNDDGMLTTNLGAIGQAHDLIIQPDGKIVAAGFRQLHLSPFYNETDFALVRYNPDGQLDTSFDHDGRVSTMITSGGSRTPSRISAIALQRDGKIVAAGSAYDYQFTMARYNSDGSLDTTFGTGGKFLVSGSLGPNSRDVVVQPNGKIVVAGNDSYYFALTRLVGGATSGIDSLTLSDSTVPACQIIEGTIRLCAPAPPGGLTLALTSTNPAATVPPSITIPEGQTEARFEVRTGSAAGVTSGYIIAGASSLTEKAPLTVRPVGVLSLTLSPNPVQGSHGVTGIVTLECRAPAGGVAVTLSSSDPAAAYPTMSQITIAPGSSRRSFTIRTNDVPSSRQAIIKATANRISKSKVLTIQ